MIKNKSKNLFDKSVNFIESGSLDIVGIEFVSTIRARTNGFIEVNQNTQYRGSVNNIYIVRSIFYYDVSFNYISQFVNDNAAFTTPTNTKYIRVLFRKLSPFNGTIDSSDIEIISNTFQLELGSTATAYVPYNDIQVAVGQFEQGQGKNLFDKGSSYDGLRLIETTGLTQVSSPWTTSDFIKVKGSTQYNLSYGENQPRIVQYDSNYNYITGVLVGAGGTNYTFTTQANTVYVRFSVVTLYINITQFELGNTATTYEPYKYLAIHNLASNDIPIPALNNKTLNEVFVGGQVNTFVTSLANVNGININRSLSPNLITVNGTATGTVNAAIYADLISTSSYYLIHNYISGTHSRRFINSASATIISEANMQQNNTLIFTNSTDIRISHINGTIVDNYRFAMPLINLTSLGIASQTKAQMDAYFEAWQRNNAGTLLANTFIQHDQNSVPIADLNGKTLDEVFIGGQLVSNGDFNNGTTGWTPIFSTLSTTENILSITGDGTTVFPTARSSSFEPVVNNTNYYVLSKIRTVQNNTTAMYMNIRGTTSGVIDTNLVINNPQQFIWYNISSKINISVTLVGNVLIGLGHNYSSTANANGAVMEVDYAYAINLTALGITATKEQLDFWYSVWQQNHKLGMRVHRASGNDIPLAVLNNQSLNQVFNSNLILNHDFSNGLTNWSLQASWTISDGVATYLRGSAQRITQSNLTFNNETLYIRLDTKLLSLQPQLAVYYTSTPANPSVYIDVVEPFMSFYTTNVTSTDLRIFGTGLTGSSFSIDNIYLLNLTSLGISTLTKSQLDYLYQVWQFNTLNALVARQFIQEA
jgi:hypothetical protein